MGGLKLAATGRAMTGAHTWARAEFTAGVADALAVLSVRSGGRFTGRTLNTASAFTLGGSWDLPSAECCRGIVMRS